MTPSNPVPGLTRDLRQPHKAPDQVRGAVDGTRLTTHQPQTPLHPKAPPFPPGAPPEFSKTPAKFLRRNLPKSFEGFCPAPPPKVKTPLMSTNNPLKLLTPKSRPAWTRP